MATKYIQTSLDNESYAKLKMLALKQEKSLYSLVRSVIKEWLKTQSINMEDFKDGEKEIEQGN